MGPTRYLRLLLRPWKVVTFLLGLAFFVWGAYYFDAPTWDVWNSVSMSALCYALAPWAVDLIVDSYRNQWRQIRLRLPLAAAIVYFVASGSYELYHLAVNGQHPITYWENLTFSVPVTIVAGLVWRFDGTLRELLTTLVTPTR